MPAVQSTRCLDDHMLKLSLSLNMVFPNESNTFLIFLRSSEFTFSVHVQQVTPLPICAGVLGMDRATRSTDEPDTKSLMGLPADREEYRVVLDVSGPVKLGPTYLSVDLGAVLGLDAVHDQVGIAHRLGYR